MGMFVRDFMTTSVTKVSKESTLDVVDDIMRWSKIRHLPVVDGDGRVEGVLSRTDVLKAHMTASRGAKDPEQDLELWRITVEECMTTAVQTIAPGTPLQEAAERMANGRFGCLPVCEDEKLVGIITATDILHFVEQIPEDDPEAVARYRERGKSARLEGGSGHKLFQDLIGSWAVQLTWTRDPDAPPEEVALDMEADWMLDGRFVRLDFRSVSAPVGTVCLGFDAARRTYQCSWLFAMLGTMLHFEGPWHPDKLSLLLSGRQPHPQDPSQRVRAVLRVLIAGDDRLELLHAFQVKGEGAFKCLEIRCQRAAPPAAADAAPPA